MRANLPPSLEDLAKQRRDANAADAAKPTFLTKEQRAAAAMKRREEEVAAQRAKMEDARESFTKRAAEESARARAGTASGGGRGGVPTRFGRDNRGSGSARGGGRGRGRGRSAMEEEVRDTHETERKRELEMLKRQYMGGDDGKKKPKQNNRNKFIFDWRKDEDTSSDLNPLYDKTFEVAPLFGRGMLGGVDRREQARANEER